MTGAVDLEADSGTLAQRSPLRWTPASPPIPGDTFTIIDNDDGGDPVTGDFQAVDRGTLKNLPEGAAFDVGEQTFTISYAAGSGSNNVVLTAQGLAETMVSLDGCRCGNLQITDINGGVSNDTLTIQYG